MLQTLLRKVIDRNNYEIYEIRQDTGQEWGDRVLLREKGTRTIDEKEEMRPYLTPLDIAKDAIRTFEECSKIIYFFIYRM